MDIGAINKGKGKWNMSQVINPNNLNVEEFNNSMHNEGKDVWWFATTAEIFGSLCGPSNNMPTSLPGNIYCPRWDKLVLTSTPTLALTTLFYHVTEIHVATQERATR